MVLRRIIMPNPKTIEELEERIEELEQELAKKTKELEDFARRVYDGIDSLGYIKNEAYTLY
jgi:archaellum component FlaC